MLLHRLANVEGRKISKNDKDFGVESGAFKILRGLMISIL